MKFLVTGSGGPGFDSPEEAVEILEEMVLPGFDELINLEKKKKIVGGLPVGERAFVFIAEASSNDDLDQMLRKLPFWGALEWQVIPLQTFTGRADQERSIVKRFKK